MNWIIQNSSLEEDELLKSESIFHTANGYIGIRGNFEEGYKKNYPTIKGAYINAFYETNTINYGEKLYGFPDTQQKILNVIDAQSIELIIEGEKFSLFNGEIINFTRTFNIKEGFTERKIHWRSLKKHEVLIAIKRITSFKRLELFLISYKVTALNFEGNIEFISRINGDVQNHTDENDPRVSSSHAQALKVNYVNADNNILTIAAETNNSKHVTACSVYHKISNTSNLNYEVHSKDIISKIETHIAKDESILLNKYITYTDSLRHSNPIKDNIQICKSVTKYSSDFWLKEQKKYLEAFWANSDVIIQGDDKLQQGVRYNVFQLLQSVGKDKYSNIAAKGLSGEGYEGHYFWDTEIYMLPFFLLTEPHLAKNLLMYRYEILDAARKRARELGHKKGALYPWRTVTGSECSAYFPAGTAQYHINADISYSFISYYLLTKDIDFMKKYGAEVLFETARLWYDTGHFSNGKFKIDCVTGPDEYTCIVNNNYYTNIMAKYNLKWAVNIYVKLKNTHLNCLETLKNKIGIDEYEIKNWEKAYLNMYIPYHTEKDINPQDDTFLNKAVWDFENTSKENYPLLLHYHPLTLYRYQVCKQADTILAHMLLEDEQDFSTIKNSYDYYEKITTHDSSLSSCIFSIMASRVGYYEKAYDYFLESVRLDLDNSHGNTRDGIHAANMGGAYLSIIYGFAGFRIKENGISFKPYLPKEWNSYSFKIIYKGSRIKVTVDKNNITFMLECGKNVEFKVYDKIYRLIKTKNCCVEILK
jgi:alpha,alpha-trehalose phosphorylase